MDYYNLVTSPIQMKFGLFQALLLQAILERITVYTYCFIHMEVCLWDKSPKVEFLGQRLSHVEA